MRIDIEELTEPELIDLNNRIVARLRFLQQKPARSAMLESRIGDRVAFRPDGRAAVVGGGTDAVTPNRSIERTRLRQAAHVKRWAANRLNGHLTVPEHDEDTACLEKWP